MSTEALVGFIAHQGTGAGKRLAHMEEEIMSLIVCDEQTGQEVQVGDVITSHNGHQATLRRATRARMPGRSGKLFVELLERSIDGQLQKAGATGEYNDNVFGLIVKEQ
jgi:hypothetical protein